MGYSYFRRIFKKEVSQLLSTLFLCTTHHYPIYTLTLKQNHLYFIPSVLTHTWHFKSERDIKSEYGSNLERHCIKYDLVIIDFYMSMDVVRPWSHTNVTDVCHTYETHLGLYDETHEDWELRLNNVCVVLMFYFIHNVLKLRGTKIFKKRQTDTTGVIIPIQVTSVIIISYPNLTNFLWYTPWIQGQLLVHRNNLC